MEGKEKGGRRRTSERQATEKGASGRAMAAVTSTATARSMVEDMGACFGWGCSGGTNSGERMAGSRDCYLKRKKVKVDGIVGKGGLLDLKKCLT